MKEIKIIDLLDMIARNDKMPSKIKYKRAIYTYDSECVDYKGENERTGDLYYLFEEIFTCRIIFLNEKVKIIEW